MPEQAAPSALATLREHDDSFLSRPLRMAVRFLRMACLHAMTAGMFVVVVLLALLVSPLFNAIPLPISSGVAQALLMGIIGVACFRPFFALSHYLNPALDLHPYLRGVLARAHPELRHATDTFPVLVVVLKPGEEPLSQLYEPTNCLGILHLKEQGIAIHGDRMALEIPERSINHVLAHLTAGKPSPWVSEITISARTAYGDREFDIAVIGGWTIASVRQQSHALVDSLRKYDAIEVTPSACPPDPERCEFCGRAVANRFPLWRMRLRAAVRALPRVLKESIVGGRP